MSSQLTSALRDFGLRSRGAENDHEHQAANDVRPVLAKLWSAVVEPILSSIDASLYDAMSDGIPHIIWCTTGPLAFLPLHAAGDYRAKAGYIDATDFVVSSYTPTLAMLLGKSSSLVQTSNSAAGDKVPIVPQPNVPGYSQLPGVVGEVEIMRTTHFPGSTMLADGDAKVEAVPAAMTQHEWVHLAFRGVQDLDEPLKSAFILTDGRLEVSRLMSHSMRNAQPAVLSACQTVTGDANLPDEAVHLTACMLATGFRSVVGTMWSIGDGDAPAVADAFYSNLKTMLEDAGPVVRSQVAYALHDAVKGLHQSLRQDEFLRWIPFVHFGI
ncbi:CHAT domain-containing protein [Vararia minispora EC-137]|uniref:CHAT domain-containing protein n=1 Tax=Vararia minispora EC-137 TaxID=1314806 RepID=A0ACB8QPI9_9AGAM|nr:CHAT domain-containing protein [Vararia minispora EC-137]